MEWSVYVVDDEAALARGIARGLKGDYDVHTFFSARSALSAIEKSPADLVLLDIGLPDMNGIDLLKQIKIYSPETLAIMITAFDQVETVVAAMKAGAHDYVLKPVQMEDLHIVIRKAVETIRMRKEIRELQEKYLKENIPFFIGESRKVQNIMRFVKSVASSPDTPILIMGKSGTGKDLIARAIHYRSPHFKGPIVSLNCAALPGPLVESELFGYEKGAFTGADQKGKKGLLEQADGGTLFLDEIGDLSSEAQAKLLRFLETGTFYRVGGTKEVGVQTRLVSATNKDLSAMIQKEQFREDLYYRIGVVKIEMPSLNERPEDILLIARYFLVEFSDKFGKKISGIAAAAENFLKEYQWSGNVRELKNVMERAVLICPGSKITVEDLGISKQSMGAGNLKKESEAAALPSIPEEGVDLLSILASVEKSYFKAALKAARNNETRAAEMLNIKYSTFRYRKRNLGVL
jgi:DNA-binding NtrC family response regulator